MRRILGWILLGAGLAALAAAAVTGIRRAPEIAALRQSIAGRVEERRVTRDQLAAKRMQGAALRASRDAMPDSLWQEERARIFSLLRSHDREIRALQSQENAHTRWITLDEHKLARKKRALTVRVGTLGGAGLLMCGLGWVLARRRVGA